MCVGVVSNAAEIKCLRTLGNGFLASIITRGNGSIELLQLWTHPKPEIFGLRFLAVVESTVICTGLKKRAVAFVEMFWILVTEG